MVLAWSPIVGEVAVLRYTPNDEKVSLSFYIGGKHLKSYTRNELKLLGADVDTKKKSCAIHLKLEILGNKQFPIGTNGYAFKINFQSFGVRYFDVTTGLEVFE